MTVKSFLESIRAVLRKLPMYDVPVQFMSDIRDIADKAPRISPIPGGVQMDYGLDDARVVILAKLDEQERLINASAFVLSNGSNIRLGHGWRQ